MNASLSMGRSTIVAFKTAEAVCRFITGNEDAEIYRLDDLKPLMTFETRRHMYVCGTFRSDNKKVSFGVALTLENVAGEWVPQGTVEFKSMITHNYNDGIRLNVREDMFISLLGASTILLAEYREWLANRAA